MNISLGRDETKATVMIGMTFLDEFGSVIGDIDPRYITLNEAPDYKIIKTSVEFDNVFMIDIEVCETDEPVWILLTPDSWPNWEYAWDTRISANPTNELVEYRYSVYHEERADKVWGPPDMTEVDVW